MIDRRQITDRNRALTGQPEGPRGASGAFCRYRMTADDIGETINFSHVNNETLLAALADRFEAYQRGPGACAQNAAVLHGLRPHSPHRATELPAAPRSARRRLCNLDHIRSSFRKVSGQSSGSRGSHRGDRQLPLHGTDEASPVLLRWL